MANKQPYMPLYIGDWERDTNCLSPLGEFALLKLSFKLFSAEKKGTFITNFRALSILFKSNMVETKAIFDELIFNNILNLEPLENDNFMIISRRMTREAIISEIRSESGSQGGRGIKAKEKQKESKRKAKLKQNADIDIEYIVKLLNEKSGKNFDFNTEKTQQFIRARKKDGYTRFDFERVITQKCLDWVEDVKMFKFLRPETLFGPKFESYLNDIPKPKFFNQINTATISESDYAKP